MRGGAGVPPAVARTSCPQRKPQAERPPDPAGGAVRGNDEDDSPPWIRRGQGHARWNRLGGVPKPARAGARMWPTAKAVENKHGQWVEKPREGRPRCVDDPKIFCRHDVA